MKNVMSKAWEIAKEGAKKFGGKVKEYFSEALRMAWAVIKEEAVKVKKTLVREIEFGKAVAVVEVTAFTEKKRLDGIVVGEEVIMTSNVKVTKDGKEIGRASFADVSDYNSNPKWFDKMGLSVNQKISRVGEKAITLGEEAGRNINAAIEEMKAELAAEFNTKTEKEVEMEEKIKEAKVIVELAEKEGIENLMSTKEIAKWRDSYNIIHNEGGEGYIPTRISSERYKEALSLL